MHTPSHHNDAAQLQRNPFDRALAETTEKPDTLFVRQAMYRDYSAIRGLYLVNGIGPHGIPSEVEIARRICAFPSGQLVAVDGDTIVGFSSASRLAGSAHLLGPGIDCRNVRTFLTEGMELFFRHIFLRMPHYDSTEIFRLIEQEHRASCRQQGLSTIAGVIRIPGFFDFSDRFGVQEYLNNYRDGRLINRSLQLWTAQGYQILYGLTHYRLDDIPSAGCAAVVEWKALTDLRLEFSLGLAARPTALVGAMAQDSLAA